MVGGPFKFGCSSISYETDSMIERVACLIEKEARVTCVDAPMVSSRVPRLKARCEHPDRSRQSQV